MKMKYLSTFLLIEPNFTVGSWRKGTRRHDGSLAIGRARSHIHNAVVRRRQSLATMVPTPLGSAWRCPIASVVRATRPRGSRQITRQQSTHMMWAKVTAAAVKRSHSLAATSRSSCNRDLGVVSRTYRVAAAEVTSTIATTGDDDDDNGITPTMEWDNGNNDFHNNDPLVTLREGQRHPDRDTPFSDVLIKLFKSERAGHGI